MTLLSLFKKSWVNGIQTPSTWLKSLELLAKRKDLNQEDVDKFGELGFSFQEALNKISSQQENLEKCSLQNFVGLIYDTELYTRFMRVRSLTKSQIELLVETYNEISTEPFLSLESTAIITTSSTTATGPAQLVDVPDSGPSNATERLENDDLDTIGKLLAPQLGTSNTGSICSSISIQQDDGLTMLKYPEDRGYAIVEVNLARFSKVAHLESNEAWKAYDFRTKIVLDTPLDHIHILAMKLIRNVTERLRTREDFKRSHFKHKTHDETRTKRAFSPESDRASPIPKRKKTTKGKTTKKSRF